MKKKAEKTYVRRKKMERKGNNQVDEKETQQKDVHNEEKEILGDDLVLNEDSTITRSYKLIERPLVSYEDHTGAASVLNSECVLAISSGSLYKRSNAYEDKLNECEDQRFIEMLYGAEGGEVIENIKSDPSLALACVMKRVKQRQEEWRTCLYEFKEPWGEVYARNFQKSLDHKTYDKKS
ncbi:hypothetical protein ARALYDRAFT_892116 [Arabidopsis lyrata subsp. lyrata]|uniref:Uncharacterized protein n=1 Tax=Arabidopsis lyrata subsp. lyrata TaxID=81972 RepID=D7KHS4_ARALL|nr:hypothetical protein ARALYDRAFT_892116 [Arabidopsis lyrata subsp. lyrata]